ncbi:hypothetical protein O6R08_10350 [Cutibacterium equinum]|uniref:ECF transporter S component n=1 Tax=Cutibacterium equinum TaxID=3016342 RepID=A0ABY7QYR2_9ACTN|nr:hypothetical protein [Cutibacterium equinum]WCC79845.1 hypothetical protein O6R08_10350 [Cutibacterium equinum]
MFLFAPILWPRHAATAEQYADESLLVLLLAAVWLLITWCCLWLDSYRDSSALSWAVLMVVANTLIRQLLNAGGGFEFNYALPMLAGLAGGAPVGFLVGGTSALLSHLTLNLVTTPMPGQILAWGLFGLLGGLLHKLPSVWAWLVACPVSVAGGVVAGVLLNLTGWPTQEPEGSYFFFPMLDSWTNLVRLWGYSASTSFGWDLARGICSGILIAVVGLPALIKLRAVWGFQPQLTEFDLPAESPDEKLKLHEKQLDFREHWKGKPGE